MIKRNLVSVASICIVVTVLFSALWLNAQRIRPNLVGVADRPTANTTECDFAGVKEAAEKSRSRYSDIEPYLSEAGREREASRVKVAEKLEAEARICEERLLNTADLEAQWAAANAAKNSSVVAAAHLQWAYFDSAVLILTLCAAVVAAVAAWQSIATTTKMTQASTRAYLSFKPGNITINPVSVPAFAGHMRVNLQGTLFNTGQSPAKYVELEYGARQIPYTERSLPTDVASENKEPPVVVEIGGGQQTPQRIEFTLAIDAQKLTSGAEHIYFACQLSYLDAFKLRQETELKGWIRGVADYISLHNNPGSGGVAPSITFEFAKEHQN